MENNLVEYKDREDYIYFRKLALNTLGFQLNYQDTDLLLRILKHVDNTEGETALVGLSNVYSQWHSQWEEYFKQLQDGEETAD